jgi:hypothetical protein
MVVQSRGVMAEASKAIREFFDEYAKATGSLDLAFLGLRTETLSCLPALAAFKPSSETTS